LTITPKTGKIMLENRVEAGFFCTNGIVASSVKEETGIKASSIPARWLRRTGQTVTSGLPDSFPF
jgi:hypothetical protein